MDAGGNLRVIGTNHIHIDIYRVGIHLFFFFLPQCPNSHSHSLTLTHSQVQSQAFTLSFTGAIEV